MCGLFTGLSVISCFEILYWVFFKVLLHKNVSEVEPSDLQEVKVCLKDDKLEEDMSEKRIKTPSEGKVSLAFDAIFRNSLTFPSSNK